ncbi:hypothetical protein K1T71_007674 [Dendrolimus kikuchii]|uniref:Uncharacterized protein n=1 Tax=Dendrolimus kikuchii TaxID=765133 RepID=A0ACC1CYE5_9NEOP|nr:hypothetical protein K1T71_007674 [Dendrolimus kikuchii]
MLGKKSLKAENPTVLNRLRKSCGGLSLQRCLTDSPIYWPGPVSCWRPEHPTDTLNGVWRALSALALDTLVAVVSAREPPYPSSVGSLPAAVLPLLMQLQLAARYRHLRVS